MALKDVDKNFFDQRVSVAVVTISDEVLRMAGLPALTLSDIVIDAGPKHFKLCRNR